MPAASTALIGKLAISFFIVGCVLSKPFSGWDRRQVPQMRFDSPMATLQPARMAAVNKG